MLIRPLVGTSLHGRAVIFCAFLVASLILPGTAQNTSAKSVPEPKEADIFYVLDSSGNLISLEFSHIQRQWNDMQVKGDHSPVRFPTGVPLTFVVRLSSGSHVSLFKTAVDSGYRVIPIVSKDHKAIIKPGSGAAQIALSGTKNASGTVQLHSNDSLDAGEYCIGVSPGNDAYCFGLDAGGEAGTGTAVASTAQPAASGPAMTNADVIKLASASLPADVIIASIHRASGRNFDLSVDGLIALKNAHVPDEVIKAMTQDSSAGDSATPAASPARAGAPAAAVADAQIPEPPDNGVFYMVGPGGRLRKLEPIRASITDMHQNLFEGNQVAYRVYGAHSPVRTSDPSPAIVIRLVPKDNKVHVFGDYDVHDLNDMYFRRFESVEGARQTMVSPRNRRRGQTHVPDPGEFEFSIVKLGADFYKVVPNEPLIAGEYCASDVVFTDISPIYCFGIDAPH